MSRENGLFMANTTGSTSDRKTITCSFSTNIFMAIALMDWAPATDGLDLAGCRIDQRAEFQGYFGKQWPVMATACDRQWGAVRPEGVFPSAQWGFAINDYP